MEIPEEIKEFWNNEHVQMTLTVVGAVVIAYLLLKLAYHIIQALRLYFCSQYCCKGGDYVKKYGKWAVITGATDGIGLAMARDLARRGHSIVVIGRNKVKLAAAKESIEKETSVGDVVTVKIDLSDSTLTNFERIRERIDPDNLDIGILINNAGTFPSVLKRFHRYEADSLQSLVNVNVLATVYMTNMILPGMIKRGRGLIVNVSSMFGQGPGYFMALYSPTKAFVDAFSRQLQIEYYSHPIDIINLTPGSVHTKMSINSGERPSKPGLFNPAPDTYAKSALNAVSTGISSFCGIFAHELIAPIMTIKSPIWLIGNTAESGMRAAGMKIDVSPVMRRKNPSAA